MPDVEIDYAAVAAASEAMRMATENVTYMVSLIAGDTTGVENPAQRSSLRLEVHSALEQLRTAVDNRLSSSLELIASFDRVDEGFRSYDSSVTVPEGS